MVVLDTDHLSLLEWSDSDQGLRLRMRLEGITANAAATTIEQLIQHRIRIGTMDLKIAAIVLSRGATLLTCNQRDFGQVPGLRFEDWTK
jgi:predicted nucleic acid-binding protein